MKALSVNVSAASPFGDVQRRVAGMTDWARAVVAAPDRPQLVFAQECTPGWLDVWRQAGYQVVLSDASGQPQYKVVSAILAAPGTMLVQVTVDDVPTLAYHGSYVAAARWQPAQGPSVLLMSVHASPVRAKPYSGAWPQEVAAPHVRASTSDEPSSTWAGVWDSDALLATLRAQALRSDVLAVGDYNEALGWDATHEGTDGADFFAAVTRSGLVSVLHERWGGSERPTRRLNGVEGLQLDHVVATPGIAEWVGDAEIDAAWAAAADQSDWSDHAPVWFNVDGPPAVL